jgi:CheY-like chemotaxis protein
MSKVLVVEDDNNVREAICDLLRDEGYETLPAKDGTEAIRLLGAAADDLPSLILLDLMMPGMNGWQLRMWLRADPLYARIPVLLLSAVDDLAREARALGAADYVLKPVDGDALLRAVRGKMSAAA